MPRSYFQFGLGTLFVLTSVVALVIIAYMRTFHYEYYVNPDTRVHGWPVPVVVFQRRDATSPWLDFVGPTLILAYPMNLAFYSIGPVVALVAVRWIRRKRRHRPATHG